jgi:hypothetical protein
MSDQPNDPNAFVPFVGIVTPDGTIHLRRYDAIIGFDTREALTPQDGCLVIVKGEKAIQSKLSPMNLSNQVRACEHWVAVRQLQEQLAIAEKMQRSQMNGIALPGR